MIITLYVHGSKEAAYDAGKKAGLTAEALKNFMYAALEVKLTLAVDEEGNATITYVEDFEVMRPE